MSRRLSAKQRRAQLLGVAKQTFADLGYDGATVEEIAARAGVSKPVVYEHFGGKEGLFAVVVDHERSRLLDMITSRLADDVGGREQIRSSAMAFLDYLDDDPAGFRVLTRDSPAGFGQQSMAGLLGDVADTAEAVLRANLERAGVDTAPARLYAHALVGMVVHVGALWTEDRSPDKATVAEWLTGLVYEGLQRVGLRGVAAQAPSTSATDTSDRSVTTPTAPPTAAG